jgi:LPXTG-motif cell wall-anchored protein
MGARSAVAARVALGLLLAGGTVTGPFAAPASAECELSEQVLVSPTSARPGQPVTVIGSNFTEGCTDGTNTVRPARAVSVVFNQAGKESQLALVNAGPGPNYAFTVKVVIPTTATAGPANVSARTAAALFTVEAGGPVAQPSPAPSSTGGAPLPNTGTDSGTLTAMASGLLCAGAGCVIIAGRRRARRQSTSA